MKRIVFFSKNLEIGGMEKALVSLLNRLCDRYQITLVLEEKKGFLLSELSPAVVVEEYRISAASNPLIRKLTNAIKRTLWAIGHRHKYDFACNYATYSVIGSRLAVIASSNRAYYIHSNYYEALQRDVRQIRSFFKPHRMDRFQHIVFVSNESRLGLAGIFPKLQNKFTVINNIIEADKIRALAKEPIKEEALFQGDRFHLVFIGRFDNDAKNLDLLLRAFQSVIEKNGAFRLFLIGDGPARATIQAYVRENRLEDHVFLLGEKENPYPYLMRGDCLVLTSRYEGFPVVYLEALVLNKLIATTVLTSDESLDMRDFCIHLSQDPGTISEQLLSLKKQSIDYHLDFDALNEKKIAGIRQLMEE